MFNRRARTTIRIVAGGYLLYLVYQINRDIISAGQEVTAGYIFSLIFAIAGAAFVVTGIRDLIVHRDFVNAEIAAGSNGGADRIEARNFEAETENIEAEEDPAHEAETGRKI